MWVEFDNNMLMSEIPELGDIDLDMLGLKTIPEIKIENFEIEDSEEETMVEKKLLCCPSCGHINEEKAFKNYENSK
jgi:hypothetical protein